MLHGWRFGLCVLTVLAGASSAWAQAIPESSQGDSTSLSSVIKTDAVSTVIEGVLDSVVLISTSENQEEEAKADLPTSPNAPLDEFFKDFFARQQNGEKRARPTGEGSGFVVDSSGVIVTNYHVIDGADRIEVMFNDGTKLPAEVIGKDKEIDVAVLRVKPKGPLTAVKFGDSDALRMGEWLVAVGNPFGIGLSATAGIVSGRNRDIRTGRYDNFIQTDASINKGNSGGPLFNLKGEVVGINTAILSPTGGSVGIGFAVPANAARPIITQLLQFGETRRGYIGVRIQDVPQDILSRIGLDRARGALVAGLVAGGPAEQAGLHVGDVVLSFDGKPVATSRAFQRIVADAGTDREIDAVVWRDGKEVTLKVKAGRLEGEDKKDGSQEEGAVQTTKILGLELAPLNDTLRRKFDLDASIEKGVVVVGIEASSPLAGSSLKAGFVITEVAQKAIAKPEDVQAVLDAAKKSGQKSVLALVSSPKAEMRFVRLPVQ